MLMLDVVGLDEQEALNQIRKFCFIQYLSYNITYKESSEYEEGKVIKTIPAAGEHYNDGDVIHIVLSKGNN